MSTEIHIRPATGQDLKTLSEFTAELLRNWNAQSTSEDALRVYERVVDAPDSGVIFVAEAEGAIVGFIYATYQRRAEFAGETMDMVELFVAQTSRNKGVGRSLLKVLLDHARSRNIHRITCQVHPGNAAIERALDSAGFDPERRTLWSVLL